jgi:hypothetical protein
MIKKVVCNEPIDGLIAVDEDGSRWLSLDEPCSISMELACEKVSENLSAEMIAAAVKIWVGGNQELFSEEMLASCHSLMRTALISALAQSASPGGKT